VDLTEDHQNPMGDEKSLSQRFKGHYYPSQYSTPSHNMGTNLTFSHMTNPLQPMTEPPQLVVYGLIHTRIRDTNEQIFLRATKTTQASIPVNLLKEGCRATDGPYSMCLKMFFFFQVRLFLEYHSSISLAY